MLEISYRRILGVAIPLMVSTFIQSIVLITDASFLSRFDTLSFDAAGNAGLIYVTVFMCMQGLGDASQIVIARRIGQDNTHAIGRIFGTSILGQALIALLFFALIQFFFDKLIFSYSRHADIATAQSTFIGIRSYGLLFAMLSLPIQAFFFATGKTWVVLVCSVITAVSNIVLDYLFIFGFGNFAALGLEGAAIASVIADGLGMLSLCFFLLRSQERRQFRLLGHLSFNAASFRELFRIGIPLMLQGFLALATWTVFFTWVEQMGKFELTVSQNIRSIYFLAFVPVWGFAATTKTYISQYLGRNNLAALPLIKRRIQLLTLAFLLLFFHGAILYPEKLISLINPGEAYVETSASILRYIFFSILLFGFASVYFQTINGSGHTRITLFIELISTFVYILSAFLFVKIFEWDIFYVWTVEYVYFGTLALLSVGYLRFFEWRTKEV